AAGLGSPAALRTIAADASVESEVDRVIDTAGPLDHVVSTAADPRGAYAPITEFDTEAARRFIDTKLIGSCLLAKYAAPRLRAGGSITFTAGVAAYRPRPGA